VRNYNGYTESTLDGSRTQYAQDMKRRRYLKDEYGKMNYKKCPILLGDDTTCGTPIRPEIVIDPASGKISTGKQRRKRTGIIIHLTRMCEVCWRENKSNGNEAKLHLTRTFRSD